eukprot:382832-Heterocapsa_arctica.AAC.1
MRDWLSSCGGSRRVWLSSCCGAKNSFGGDQRVAPQRDTNLDCRLGLRCSAGALLASEWFTRYVAERAKDESAFDIFPNVKRWSVKALT